MLDLLKTAFDLFLIVSILGIWYNGPGKLRAGMLLLVGVAAIAWGIVDFNDPASAVHINGVDVSGAKFQYLGFIGGAALIFGSINDLTLIRKKLKK